MGKEIVNHIQEAQRAPYRINPRRNMLRHILIKLTKIQDEKKKSPSGYITPPLVPFPKNILRKTLKLVKSKICYETIFVSNYFQFYLLSLIQSFSNYFLTTSHMPGYHVNKGVMLFSSMPILFPNNCYNFLV